VNDPEDLHQLAEGEFLEEVYSFEFWFQSVEGYLAGRHYGHGEDVDAVEESDRDGLITALCNYCVGETTALEGASGLIAIAPNRAAKIFLATQAVDEARHLEVFIHRLEELGVEDPAAEIEQRASPALITFKGALLDLIKRSEWEAAVFAQNVILEAMEFTVFGAHLAVADTTTREILEGVVADERRHMGFGENCLGRQLASCPELREQLVEVRRTLDPLVFASFEETMTQLGTDADKRTEVGRSYSAVVSRLGLGQ
jgi:rubrerythrin